MRWPWRNSTAAAKVWQIKEGCFIWSLNPNFIYFMLKSCHFLFENCLCHLEPSAFFQLISFLQTCKPFLLTITWPYTWPSQQLKRSLHYITLADWQNSTWAEPDLSSNMNLVIVQLVNSVWHSWYMAHLLCLHEASDFNMVDIDFDFCKYPGDDRFTVWKHLDL